LGGASNPFGNELVELLASAGGTRDSAGSTVLVMRATAGDKRETIRLDLGKLLRGDNFDDNNPELQEGDIVVVPEADVFYVYGQVRSPGRYPIERDMKVMHALSIAGGITDRGNEKDLELMRGEGDSPRKKALLSDEVQPGDVIYVSERFF
jgi:polysaccharide export outer membrane protein